VDSDGDGLPDYADLDSDNDGMMDKVEVGTGIKPVDTDADGTPDYLDLDSDGDGLFDTFEATYYYHGDVGVPKGTVAGPFGANGLADAAETAPDSGVLSYSVNNINDSDSDGTPDFQEVDSDNDGIPDVVEKGVLSDGLTAVDSDGDDYPDFQDTDSDDDGLLDAIERGANGAKPLDTDLDGTPNYIDLDSDNDCVPDSNESTPFASIDAADPKANPSDNCSESPAYNACDTTKGQCVSGCHELAGCQHTLGQERARLGLRPRAGDLRVRPGARGRAGRRRAEHGGPGAPALRATQQPAARGDRLRQRRRGAGDSHGRGGGSLVDRTAPAVVGTAVIQRLPTRTMKGDR
jgi:hypothetical protein